MPRRPSDARKRIVQAALALFATRGYHNTGIADILKESGVKRGSLYHYFPSKKELGFAAIDEMMRLHVEEGAARHLRTTDHPIDRLLKVLDDLPTAVKLETINSTATDVSIRMASADEDFQKWLERSVEALIDELEGVLSRGVADGQIVDGVNPRVLSHVMVVVVQGIQLTSLLGQREVIWGDARRWLKEHLNSLRK
jgi:AcrR family transcriptional regulator